METHTALTHLPTNWLNLRKWLNMTNTIIIDRPEIFTPKNWLIDWLTFNQLTHLTNDSPLALTIHTWLNWHWRYRRSTWRDFKAKPSQWLWTIYSPRNRPDWPWYFGVLSNHWIMEWQAEKSKGLKIPSASSFYRVQSF